MRGINLRMQKLLHRKQVVFLALDHGFSMGPIYGLEDLGATVKKLARCDVDAVILHRGAIKNLPLNTFEGNFPPLIMHLAGSDISNGVNKFLTADPYQALLLGADAVSFQINIGTQNEETQIKEAVHLIERADGLELPVLLMIYDKRNHIEIGERIRGSIRLSIELGADMVKIDPGDDFQGLQEAIGYSSIPVFIAGGEKMSDEDVFLRKIQNGLGSGIRGVSVGRNIFQNSNAINILEKLCDFVHKYEK